MRSHVQSGQQGTPLLRVVVPHVLARAQVHYSVHVATPFGAVASVHSWERVGAALLFISRKYLKLPIFRYVDDYFGIERCFPPLYSPLRCMCMRYVRRTCLEHAWGCFARLVRLLLGGDAVAESKLEHGRSLCILGIDVSPSRSGYTCRPTPLKVQQWSDVIQVALSSSSLSAGDASKLGGKLS